MWQADPPHLEPGWMNGSLKDAGVLKSGSACIGMRHSGHQRG